MSILESDCENLVSKSTSTAKQRLVRYLRFPRRGGSWCHCI